jgi:DNA-directed RNA polymerase
MGQLLRKAFVEQYRGDVLGTFRQEIVDQLIASGAPELAAELPPVPKFGTLDIEDVMNSEYFFA